MSIVGLTNRWVAKLTGHIPPGRFGRYLLVGAWNTLFGYGSFAFFTKILSPLIPHSYIVASVISSLLNISVAYFGYKFFVFKGWVAVLAIFLNPKAYDSGYRWQMQ